jgi:hypothetical protein
MTGFTGVILRASGFANKGDTGEQPRGPVEADAFALHPRLNRLFFGIIAPNSPSMEKSPLRIPPQFKRLHQNRERHLRRLLPIQNRLDDFRREEHHSPAGEALGRGLSYGSAQSIDGVGHGDEDRTRHSGLAAAPRRALPQE